MHKTLPNIHHLLGARQGVFRGGVQGTRVGGFVDFLLFYPDIEVLQKINPPESISSRFSTSKKNDPPSETHGNLVQSLSQQTRPFLSFS